MIDPADLRDVFDRAASLAPADRAAFLDRACTQNVALRREVERLLDADARHGSVFETHHQRDSRDGYHAALTDALGARTDTLGAGERLGPYEIVTAVGAGGMGEVYKARDTRLDRTVAVKVLPPDLITDPTARHRFEREARAAAALTHPHVCTLLDVGRQGDLDYLVMEYVEGQTLAHQLAYQKLPLSKALTYGIQIADALAAAHRAGIVHRDIKPENVMLRPDGFVKVLDFGVAKLVAFGGAPPVSTRTTSGMVMGTVAYMSPEQARGQEVDPRTDVWSLGCVLYEMVVGRSPFAGTTSSDVLAALLQTEPAPLARFDPAVPTELQRIVSKALRKDRDERYQTMQDLLLDLRALSDDVSVQRKLSGEAGAGAPGAKSDARARSGGGMTSQPFPAGTVPGGVRRNWLVPSAALVLVVGALAGAGWWALQRGRGRAEPATPVQRILTRITFGSGLQTAPTFSPDGRFIAYASDRAGNLDIWVQPVGGGNAVQVTHSPAQDTQPAWSPEGSTLVFRSDRDGGGLYLVPALGGTERVLVNFGAFPSWSADGSAVRFLAGAMLELAEVSPVGLYAVGLKGDPPRQIQPEFTRDGSWHWIGAHPDGRTSFLGRHRTLGLGFFTVSDDGRVTVSKQAAGTNLPSLVRVGTNARQRFQWDPRGRALYIEGLVGMVRNLWRVQIDPVTLEWTSAEPLTTGAGADVDAALSRDGTRMVFTTSQDSERLWSFPFDPFGMRLGEGRPVSEEGAEAAQSDLSPDGTTAAFTIWRVGTDTMGGVWFAHLDTGRSELVVSNGEQPRFSRDGHQFVYMKAQTDTVDPTTRWLATALAVRSLAGPERLISPWDTKTFLAPSDWTPDDRAVLVSVMSPGTDTRLALWPVASPVKEPRTLMSAPGVGLWQARFSPNGRWLSFVADRDDKPGVAVTRADGAPEGEWVRIAADHARPDKPRWSSDGKQLYFLSRQGGSFLNLWGVRFDPERGTPVGSAFKLSHFDSPGFHVSPRLYVTELNVSDHRVVMTMRTAAGNIWMLDNVDR